PTPSTSTYTGCPSSSSPSPRRRLGPRSSPHGRPRCTLLPSAEYRLEFPRVVQIVSDAGESLAVDIDAIEPIRVSAEFDPTETWMEFEAGSPGQGLGLEIHDREVA